MKTKTSSYQFDLEVIRLYLKRDAEAEKWLYDNLYRFISKMLQSFTQKGIIFSDRENVISQIIYKIMVAEDRRILRNYGGQCKLSSYLFPIIRNKIIDAYRKELAIRNREQLTDNYHSDTYAQENEVSDIEVVLDEHFSQIPPFERSIKISKWIDRLSYDQIIEKVREEFPEETTLNKSRIAYLLFTNRKKLQKKLKKYIVK